MDHGITFFEKILSCELKSDVAFKILTSVSVAVRPLCTDLSICLNGHYFTGKKEEDIDQGWHKSTNSWLGNDKIHRITQQKDYEMEMRVDYWEQKSIFEHCSLFRVDYGGDRSGYSLTISGCNYLSGIYLIFQNLLTPSLAMAAVLLIFFL